MELEKAKVVVVVEVYAAGRTQGEGAECPADIFEYFCWRSLGDDWLTSIPAVASWMSRFFLP